AQNRAVRSVLGGCVRLADSVLERASAGFFFAGGAYALQKNRPLQAWDFFSQGLDKADDHNYLRTAGATLYVGLGRMRDALAMQRRADDLRLTNAARLGIVQADLWVLDYLWFAHIGHAAQIDYIVKLAQLENRDRRDTILYCSPEHKVANRSVVTQ